MVFCHRTGVRVDCLRQADSDAITNPVVMPHTSVASIEMLPSTRALSFVGMTDRLGARRVLGDGTLHGGSRLSPHLYSWASDTPDVVAVDSLGMVTAL
jgi:hypothetical protein